MPQNTPDFRFSIFDFGFIGMKLQYIFRNLHSGIRNRCVRVYALFLISIAATGCVTDPATKMLPTGWQQLAAGQADQALTTAENILAEAPTSPRAAEVLYLKGRALEAKVAASPLAQRMNLSNAAAAYAAALRANPTAALSGRIYSGIANTFYWQDDYSNAWRNWVKAHDLAVDDADKAYMLYRIGLCQQRLGQFDDADRTLAAVGQEYPSTDAAKRAAQKRGAKAFAVQVATFASPQTAENAMNTLRREGFIPSKLGNSQGQTVVTVTPFNNYQQAQAAKARLTGLFPDAVVVP